MEHVYHVMNRTARRHEAFHDDRDRNLFLETVGDACADNHTEVLSYCLMGNHYHLQIASSQEDLPDFMKDLGQNYTQLFNRIHGYDGALFRGGYESVLVDSDEYLLNLSRYIHRNVLELGFRVHPYPWSSYAAYIGCRPPQPWLNPERVLRLLSAHTSYRTFVETDVDSDVLSMTMGARIHPPEPTRPEPLLRFNIVDDVVADWFGCTPGDLRTASPGAKNRPRQFATLLAREVGIFPAAASAAHYGFSSESAQRTATSRMRQRLATSPNLTDQFDHLKAIVMREVGPRASGFGTRDQAGSTRLT